MNFIAQLNELAENHNIEAMDTLVASLSPAQLEAEKQAIIEAYDMVYTYGMYDLDCGKVSDPEDFAFYLLDIITSSIQRFFPDQLYCQERGACYQYLARHASNEEDKVRYIHEAIHIYNIAPRTARIQMAMVGALTDKMEITRMFTTEAFTEIIYYFKQVITDTDFISAAIHQCFRVRALPFEQNQYWFQRLLSEFEAVTYKLAEKHPLVYLEWARTYHYILFNDYPAIEPAYKQTMIALTVALLEPLEGYYTEDPETLNRLGKAFADTAIRSADMELKLAHYSMAVHFFTRGHELQPAAWTFPVYATNALLGMANIYHDQGAYEKLINTFEQGMQLFSQVHRHEEDFQLNLYWGDFLLAYTGLAYNYKSPSINRLAEEKLQLAAALGRNFYSQPYFSMARLAIKSGDKEKCVELLLKCREAIRATGFDAYDLGDAIKDEDFREIRDQLS